jgi:hypothetical protein
MRPAPTPAAIPDIPEKPRVPRYLSCRTVARSLDVSLAWVRAWHRAGILKGFVLHAVPGDRGRLLFLETDVRAFLAARGLPADEEGTR